VLTKGERESSEMFELKSFNNWIKAVLINKYCEIRNSDLQKIYDLPSTFNRNLLHVLDIGSGHGQDLKKWSSNRVSYLVAVDISAESLAEYKQRWDKSHKPYALKVVAINASNPDLYQAV
jgi:mRNA (guanine-N7-)-methyltransferase